MNQNPRFRDSLRAAQRREVPNQNISLSLKFQHENKAIDDDQCICKEEREEASKINAKDGMNSSNSRMNNENNDVDFKIHFRYQS